MKKSILPIVLLGTIILASCTTVATTVGTAAGGQILGGVVNSVLNTNTISNVINNVIGTDKITASNLVGTWKYSGPGCAFTSEKALAQAGGEVVATQIKEKLQPSYDKIGFTPANTVITFKNDSTFTATIAGKSFKGSYTYSEANAKITLKGLLLNANCYAKRNGINGIAILFEAKKLLSMFQTIAALSGNSDLETISEISKNYQDARIGFDMTK